MIHQECDGKTGKSMTFPAPKENREAQRPRLDPPTTNVWMVFSYVPELSQRKDFAARGQSSETSAWQELQVETSRNVFKV